MFEQVAKILSEHKDIPVDSIKPETTFEELGLDSLDTVELVMMIEEQTGVSVTLSEGLKTVNDFVKLIEAAK